MISARRALSAICLLLVLSAAAWVRFHWIPRRAPAGGSIAALGRKLPPLPVADASGRLVDLSRAVIGRRTVIAFYSASCHVCQVVLPELRPFPQALDLVLVNEESGETPGKGPETLGFERASQFQDPDGVFFRSFPLSPVPTILFVDEHGVLRSRLIGSQGRELVQGQLWGFAEGAS